MHRPYVRGSIAALAACCLVVALAGCGHGDPDPGGGILDALKTVQVAVPSDATNVVANFAEPYWEPGCDGSKGTEGWSDVTVDISFSSDRPGQELIYAAQPPLAEAGWSADGTRTSPLGPSQSWTRTLDGTILHASLGPGSRDNGATISWFLYASAPPHGRRASGC